MSTKSIISSSTFERRTKCPASGWFEEEFGIRDVDNTSAEEGIKLHKELEDKINNFELEVSDDVQEAYNVLNSYFNVKYKYDKKRIDACFETITEYGKKYFEDASAISEQDDLKLEQAKQDISDFHDLKSKPVTVQTEKYLLFASRILGVADIVIENDKERYIIDYKTGQNYVDEKNNYQLQFLATCAAFMLDESKSHKKTYVGILQKNTLELSPNYGQMELRIEELDPYIIEHVRMCLFKARYEYENKSRVFLSGEHCKYCKSRDSCAEYQQTNSIADVNFNSVEDIRKFLIEDFNVYDSDLGTKESFFVLLKQLERKLKVVKDDLLKADIDSDFEFKMLEFIPPKKTSKLVDREGLDQHLMGKLGIFPESYTTIVPQKDMIDLVGKAEFEKIKKQFYQVQESENKQIKIKKQGK